MSSKIYIVGMGPGTGEMMTPQADHALCGSDVIVGYPVYIFVHHYSPLPIISAEILQQSLFP